MKKTHRLTKTEEKVIALQNGCICCTLRGDLLEELVRISQLEDFDYIIIESSGISEPEQVAETFDARLAEQMGDLAHADTAMPLDDNTVRVLKQLYVVARCSRMIVAVSNRVLGKPPVDCRSLLVLIQPSPSLMRLRY